VRPLVSYYGGKQRIANKIIPYIPDHHCYVEPFCGGASILFAKPYISKNEVLNDKDEGIFNLYDVAIHNREEFFEIVMDRALFHEKFFRMSDSILKNPADHNKVEWAWACFYNIILSFSRRLQGGMGFSYTSNQSIVLKNRVLLLEKILDRLKRVQIFCRDGLEIIDMFDEDGAFFYLDPPYPDACQGHYAGYSIDDLRNLVERLRGIRGKFILSNYEHPEIEIPKDWRKVEISTFVSASMGKNRKVTEIIYMNYQPDFLLFSLGS